MMDLLNPLSPEKSNQPTIFRGSWAFLMPIPAHQRVGFLHGKPVLIDITWDKEAG